QIRQDSKLSQVRVVLLASAFEPVDEEKLRDSGADGVISKPFDPSDLRAKLRQILEAPPRVPEGAEVSGSLSGAEVSAEAPAEAASEPVNLDSLLSAPAEAPDLSSLL